jgi:hypothetical protein
LIKLPEHQVRFACDRCACSSAAETVFTISMATVIGPTPPGTGVIALAYL